MYRVFGVCGSMARRSIEDEEADHSYVGFVDIAFAIKSIRYVDSLPSQAIFCELN